MIIIKHFDSFTSYSSAERMYDQLFNTGFRRATFHPLCILFSSTPPPDYRLLSIFCVEARILGRDPSAGSGRSSREAGIACNRTTGALSWKSAQWEQQDLPAGCESTSWDNCDSPPSVSQVLNCLPCCVNFGSKFDTILCSAHVTIGHLHVCVPLLLHDVQI